MMKYFLVFGLACTAVANQDVTNPVEKVISMLSDLQQKIIKEGEHAQKVYDEFAEWCEEESKNLQYEIKTGKAQAADLSATIEKAASDISSADEKIGALASSIATDEADLKAATEIREKEHADFSAEEADLVDAVDTLGRAITIIQREMQKGGAALVQIQNAKTVADALRTLVDASAISSKDSTRLTALIQSQHSDADADDELGAPDPTVYKSHSGGIVEVLEDILGKAEAQLSDLRKKEQSSQHNYELLKQELDDSMKFGNQELDEVKKAKSEAEQTKATSEGDLAVTQKSLAEDTALLATTHQSCMDKAEDFELSTKSRGEELKALAEAKKVILETTGGATAQSYDLAQTGASFLQSASNSHLSTRADLANFEAVRYVKALARRLNSGALAQLASRMDVAARFGASAGEDPFAKVKGLITEMISRLEKEMAEDDSHKAYCDKEMSETKAKKDELTDAIEGLSTKIDTMTARSAKLKEEVATLQKELADLAKSQAEMDKVRKEEAAAFVTNKAEMEEGLEGIKLALKILREYYAKEDKGHEAAEGAGSGIIGMLEVIESDFTKGLAEMISTETTSQAEYEKTTKENAITKVTKEQDVKYKTKEAAGLDKDTAEATSDREGLNAELESVLAYYENIKKQCIAQPETYEERKKRRDAEIAGLKEALAILEGEAVLLQRSGVRQRKGVRGIHQHVA